MEVFVARHAILDRNLSLFGYELLFRSSESNHCEALDDSACTLQVLANSLLSSGLDIIGCNKLLFINFGQELLTSEWTSLLPASSVVLEILESVKPEPQVVAACLKLRKSGYPLALDDVTGTVQEKEQLVELADFIKVDFRATTREEQRQLADSLKGSGKKLLAEKVENHEDFFWACEAGYEYFQGFFFARPALMRGQHIPGVKINALRLLKEIGSPELDFDRLAGVIKCDVSLTYKLFRYVNSALFGRRQEIRSIQEALVMLGEVGIRRWIALATLPALAAGTPHELTVHALVRARFCELLAGKSYPEAFLVGLFSLLDAFVDRPLPEILPELSLPQQIIEALVGDPPASRLGAIYRTALAYERGEWDEFNKLLKVLPVAKHAVTDLYVNAIRWSRDMLGILGPETQQSTAGIHAANHSMGNSLLALQQHVPPMGQQKLDPAGKNALRELVRPEA